MPLLDAGRHVWSILPDGVLPEKCPGLVWKNSLWHGRNFSSVTITTFMIFGVFLRIINKDFVLLALVLSVEDDKWFELKFTVMIYRFKATMRGNKQFLREYEISSSATLYDFHNFLIGDLAFSPDQLVIFRGVDKDGVVCSEYGLFDMGDGTIDNITLQECVRKGEIVFEYVYDIFNRRSMLITFTGESEEMPKESYPRLVSERGIRPDQFSSEHDTDEEFHATVKPSVADEPEDDYSDIPEENKEDDED